MSITPYAVAKLMRETRYAGAWFRVDGDRLYVVARNNSADPLPDSLKATIRTHKSSIIGALHSLPDGCRHPCSHLLACRCVDTRCSERKEIS